MKERETIIIAGGSGFMGTALATHLAKTYIVYILSRRQLIADNEHIIYEYWDGKNQGEWSSLIDGALAVINLSGRSVNCRYNEANKAEIYASRLDSTRALALAISHAKKPPKTWINAASATIYRHAEDRPMTESTGELGKGFSVDVCQKWEAAFYESDLPNTRRIGMRVTIVLADYGSVMDYFSTLVKLGLGGRMASGRQMFSWVHIEDFCHIVSWFLENENASGTYNVASPNPITNAAFMASLRKKYKIPFGLPLPKWALEIGAWMLGTETELILKSRWVIPERLLAEGYDFRIKHL